MSVRTNVLHAIEGVSPLEVAARWPADRPLIMLHSGRTHARWARWSILATPAAVFRFNGTTHLEIRQDQGTRPLQRISFTHDPLIDVDQIVRATKRDFTRVESGSRLPFQGGWIGYFSYDLGRLIEPSAQAPGAARANSNWPLIALACCPSAIVYDHVERQWSALGDLHPHLMHQNETPSFGIDRLRPDIDPDHYMSMVARTLEYIAAGDIFQANIAQRLSAAFHGSSRAVAIAALQCSRAWYGAYLELQSNSALLSLSPELFLQIDGRSRQIITRPIKGTRPASSNIQELIDSRKDAAELHMIVDLMRNDLGRICEFGSIQIPCPRMIETHPSVHHGVAEIAGRLRAEASLGDVLRATFPGGSVTGAPKIRAMQIIDELEPVRRGPYCGAIGSISDCGNVCLNIAIRTAMLSNGDETPATLEYFAGAGIVADSQPLAEYREVLAKAAILAGLTGGEPAQTLAGSAPSDHHISEPHSGQRSLKSRPVRS